jgi:Protein of unknown function (DUF3995)
MMMIAVVLAILLGAVAGLHVFWAFGGSWGKAATVPERDGRPLFRPSQGVTLLVAAALITAAACAVVRGGVTAESGAAWAARGGCWVLAAIFAVRAIGEGKYVGFMKRVRNTTFGRHDTWIYSPLCALLAAGFLALALAR